MMTKAKLNKWLKDNNLTRKEMQEIWDKLLEIEHGTIVLLNKAGISWEQLESYQLEQLPTEYERTIKDRELRAKAEQERLMEEEKKKNCAHYYEEHFEEIMIEKIEKKEELTECELERLLEYELEDEREYEEKRRWSQFVTSIIRLKDRYYSILWDMALTENGVNTFSYQPTEIYPTTKFIVKEINTFTTKKAKIEKTNEKSNEIISKYDGIKLTKKKEEKLEIELVDLLHKEYGCTMGACTIAFNKAKEVCDIGDYRSIYRVTNMLLETTMMIMEYEN